VATRAVECPRAVARAVSRSSRDSRSTLWMDGEWRCSVSVSVVTLLICPGVRLWT